MFGKTDGFITAIVFLISEMVERYRICKLWSDVRLLGLQWAKKSPFRICLKFFTIITKKQKQRLASVPVAGTEQMKGWRDFPFW